MRATLIILVVVATNASLASGQGPSYPQDSVPLNLREGILDRRKPIVAENAEAAEDLQARQPERVWARAEFLLWWMKPANFPPLVTSGPSTDRLPGALDAPNTTVLFGTRGMDYQHRGGGRFTLGAWLSDDQAWGVEANYFFLNGRSLGETFSSPGSPVLATPFFNVNKNLQDSSLVSFPGIMSGRIAVDAPSFLQGAEVNLVKSFGLSEWCRLEGIAGIRYVNLQEGLHVQSTSLVQLAPQYQGLGIPYEGNTISVSDRFDVNNHFLGGQVGARAEMRWQRWVLDLTGKLALGVNHEVVSINGSTAIDTQPATTVNAGLLAVSSNSGRFTQTSFAVVPEVGFTLKFQLTERLRLFGGYSILYWSRVARPGDQVDPNVNLNLVPTSTTFGAVGGPNRPAVLSRGGDFFAHGANFGLEFRY